MTVIETVRIEVLNLKEIEMISIAVFVLTFLVKVNIRLYISLNISLFIISPLFFCQIAQFKIFFRFFFLFIQ